MRMAKRIHSVSKLLRMTPEEAKVLSDKALAAGMDESGYLRLMISQKPNDYPEIRMLIKDLINEINRIGNNINQVVYNNNSGLYSLDDKNRLFAYMKKIHQKLDEVVRIIGD